VKTLPRAAVVPVRESADWPRTEPVGSIDYNDHSDPATEVLLVRSPERSSAKPRPVVHTVPARQETTQVTAAPRRFPKGTSPVSPTRPGMSAVRPRASADDPTATDIALDDRTTPNLPLADRTKPGIALPSARGRLAR
jgi:hypothetical protein